MMFIFAQIDFVSSRAGGSCLGKISFNTPPCDPQSSSMAETQKRFRQKQNRKATADQVTCKHTNF